MHVRASLVLVCLLASVPWPAAAQSPDSAAERARLANERIRAEAELRSRDEQEPQRPTAAASEPAPAASAQAAPQAPGPGPAPRPPATAAGPAGDGARVSRALEQLRELGELKDAGYVTEDEFRRIKARILDDQF